MRFTLEIELGNDAMQTWDDIRNAMRRTDFAIMEETRGVTVSARVGLFPIRDLNGLTVGKWEVTETPSGYLGTHVPFSPSDACWCQPFDGPKHPHCPMHGDDPMGRMYAEAFAPGSEEQQANDRAKAASADLPEGWPSNQPEPPKWGGYAETIITNPADFDALEVHGVRDLNEPASDKGTQCEVDDEDPQFFSVYAHLVEGGVECVGDFERMAEASAYGERLGKQHGWPVHIYAKAIA